MTETATRPPPLRPRPVIVPTATAVEEAAFVAAEPGAVRPGRIQLASGETRVRVSLYMPPRARREVAAFVYRRKVRTPSFNASAFALEAIVDKLRRTPEPSENDLDAPRKPRDASPRTGRLDVYMTPELAQALKILCIKLDVSVSDFCTEALREHLQQLRSRGARPASEPATT